MVARLAAVAIAALVAAGCAAPAPPAAAAAPAAVAAPVPAPPPSFENRVWRVAESTGAAPGHLYVFLSEGTLVIAGPTSTPSLGRWSRRGDGLTLVEDGVSYPTDILALTDDEFRIRSHNPGAPVDTRLVPAERPGR